MEVTSLLKDRIEDWINEELRDYLSINGLSVPETERISLHEIKDKRRTPSDLSSGSVIKL